MKVEENKENEQSSACINTNVASITEKHDSSDDELVIHVPKSVKGITITHKYDKVLSLEL